jgi:hypothetical protein
MALFASLVLWGCAQSDKPIDEETIAREVRTMESISAEAAFVCEEMLLGHLKPSFVAVHLENLTKEARKAQQEVAKPSEPLLERQHLHAQALAWRLGQSLRALAQSQFGPDERIAGEQHALLRLKSEFESLEKQL